MIIYLNNEATPEHIREIQTAVTIAGFRCSRAEVAKGRLFVHDFQLEKKPNKDLIFGLQGVKSISSAEMSVPAGIAFQLQA